jgi:PhzF family phenazine biosynthesis protein
MAQPVVQMDAFAYHPFGENPDAVCLLEEMKDDQWLQNVAHKMNPSETTFLFRQSDSFDLR